LRVLREAGFLLVGISNQPAAAKGTVSRDELERVQARVLDLLGEEGVVPDGFFICFHHPLGIVSELRGECECRKPAPGLLFEAAAALDLDLERSWMVGDTDADVEAGQAAGSHTILVEYPGSVHKRRSAVKPDFRAPDVEIASQRILVHRSR
jgi:histidinol-phosphate phosphatase family protein